ncbi:MAG: hypothetical protein K5881_10490 [Saccharofermentans sp.]|nr:hypothetical protein [Saccharofermentans sp.]
MNKFFKFSLPIGIAGIVLSLILYATNGFYELVIPLFEKTMDDGPSFTVIDNLVYYLPLFFAALFLAYVIAGQIYMKKYHEKEEAAKTGKTIEKNEAIKKELDEKAEYYRHKYYTNCPKCGAVRVENTTACSFCGTSLIITKSSEEGKAEVK